MSGIVRLILFWLSGAVVACGAASPRLRAACVNRPNRASGPWGVSRPTEAAICCGHRRATGRFHRCLPEASVAYSSPFSHSRRCLLEMPRPVRALELSWVSRRSPPTINGRSRHPRAAPTRTKLLAFGRWSFPSDSQPGPRRGKVHRPSAAPSPGTAASASERRVLAQISQNEQSLGG